MCTLDVKWPTSYIILSRRWSIKYVDELKDEDQEDPDGDLLGCSDATLCEISISKQQSESSMKDTLVHEIMHAVYSSLPGVDHDSEEAEENAILAATMMFFEVVRNADNPWWDE